MTARDAADIIVVVCNELVLNFGTGIVDSFFKGEWRELRLFIKQVE
jgi:hypothetical protein